MLSSCPAKIRVIVSNNDLSFLHDGKFSLSIHPAGKNENGEFDDSSPYNSVSGDGSACVSSNKAFSGFFSAAIEARFHCLILLPYGL